LAGESPPVPPGKGSQPELFDRVAPGPDLATGPNGREVTSATSEGDEGPA
jgi:hypothetical protein